MSGEALKKQQIFAFVHDWHLHNSAAFADMLQLPLKDYFDIKFIAWQENNWQKIAPHKPAIFCQLPPPAHILANPSHKIIWLPMWDAVVSLPFSYWQTLPRENLKIVSFCKPISALAQSVGLRYLQLQYFKDPQQFLPVNWNRGRILGYWNRRGLYSQRILQNLCRSLAIDKLVVLDVPDPRVRLYSQVNFSDMGSTQVEYHNKYLPREQYLQIMEKTNIFLAPRFYEGVGMSFLEAMARGGVVISPNTPTMNEYITSGYNGYLLGNRRIVDRLTYKTGYWSKRITNKILRKMRIVRHRYYPKFSDYPLVATQNWRELEQSEPESLAKNALTFMHNGFSNWCKQMASYANFIVDWE